MPQRVADSSVVAREMKGFHYRSGGMFLTCTTGPVIPLLSVNHFMKTGNSLGSPRTNCKQTAGPHAIHSRGAALN